MRLFGKFIDGNIKLSDVNFNEINSIATRNSAYHILRNTSAVLSDKLSLDDFEVKDINLIEDQITKDFISESKLVSLNKNPLDFKTQEIFIKKIISAMAVFKNDGETNTDFEERLEKDLNSLVEEIK